MAAALVLLGCGRPEQRAEPEAVATATAAASARAPQPGAGGEDWNGAQIAWRTYDEGLAEAKAQNKPVCLIFSTGWCPHCRNYARVFSDPEVVKLAKQMVMIRLDADHHGDLARKYAPDGGYVPRTFFLSPDGTLAADIHAPRPKFLYFFDERNPASLLGGMKQALEKLRK